MFCMIIWCGIFSKIHFWEFEATLNDEECGLMGNWHKNIKCYVDREKLARNLFLVLTHSYLVRNPKLSNISGIITIKYTVWYDVIYQI